jgi:hypothetical protein
VGPIDAADQGGSNGVGLTVAVAVLADIWWLGKVAEKWVEKKNNLKSCMNGMGVAWRVAVVGWGWDRSMEGIKAVRMVLVWQWQWQYWGRYDGWEKWQEKRVEKKNYGKSWMNGMGVAWRVTVVGWQWCQSIEQIKAVRMVLVWQWQWQYWPRYDRWEKWQWKYDRKRKTM